MQRDRLSRDELIKENKKLLLGLQQQYRAIDKSDEVFKSLTASETYIEHREEVFNTKVSELPNKTDKELRDLNRQLEYIKSLKTSSLKGIREVQKTFDPIKETLNSLDLETQKNFWKTYNRAIEELGILEKFKYEIGQEIVKNAKTITDPKETATKIINLFKEAELEAVENGVKTQKGKISLFKSKLREFL